MYIVTGGAGFIGSVLVKKLNDNGINDIIIVDSIATSEKWQNLLGKKYIDYIHKEKFFLLLKKNKFNNIKSIIHMGACSSTTENNFDYLYHNNYMYSTKLANWCLKKNVRFIYASSAATYGNGENGYSDCLEKMDTLRPINRYGYSKQLFDLWVLRQQLQNKIVGLKFFNVYGPNEYHKGDMASLAYKAFFQIQQNKQLNLFKSHHPKYKDGEQQRDFIYVKDCAEIVWWFIHNQNNNGIFNIGTGQAKTWNNLAAAVFKNMNVATDIRYMDMPEKLKQQYQYYTQADVSKLRNMGYDKDFFSLEEGISDYYQNHLLQNNCYY